MKRPPVIGSSVLALMAAACVAQPPVMNSGSVVGVKVAGNRLVSTVDGSTVVIHGMNLSGLETTGPSARWATIADAGRGFWRGAFRQAHPGTNAVRLPLNEANWLNFSCNGRPPPDPRRTYQPLVRKIVDDATAAGLYVVLDLHWGAPNSGGAPLCTIGQPAFADADHAIAFWTQVADAFKTHPNVIFELFNEPFGSDVYASGVIERGGAYAPGPDAMIMANGGDFSPFLQQDNAHKNTMITTAMNWAVAGEKTLLNAIRGEQASNVVLMSPIGWAGEIETWLGSYAASGNPDPIGQVGASMHAYGYHKGTAPLLEVLAAGYPIVITEFTPGLNSLGGYEWARQHDIGLIAWGPNDWGGPITLTPTGW